MIKYFKPSFGIDDEQAVYTVLHSGQLTSGEEVEKFEKEFATYLNAPYVVAVDNCTNALWLSLQYLFEKNGSQQITIPTMTFASVAHAVLQTRHQLEFRDTYDVGSAYQLGETGIWDYAHEVSRDGYVKGQVQCYSFYPNKLLSSAEGGAIATDDENFYHWLKLARNNGRTKGGYEYDIKMIGWKMNMTNLQAAIARTQLNRLDHDLARRQEIRQMYDQHLNQVNKGKYLYIIDTKNRKFFMDRMAEEGVETSYHFKPLHKMSVFNSEKEYPLTESLKNTVTLPLYPLLKNSEVKIIIELTKLYQYET